MVDKDSQKYECESSGITRIYLADATVNYEIRIPALVVIRIGGLWRHDSSSTMAEPW